MNKRHILLCAVSAVFMAKAGEGSGGGGGKTNRELSEEEKETRARLMEAENQRIKGIEVEGKETALAMIDAEAKNRKTQVELWSHVAKFPTEAQAKAFRDGFEKACNEKAESAGEGADEAKNVKRNVSILNRIIRAIFGWNRKVENSDTVVRVYAKGMTQDVEGNREIILKVLTGPGKWQVKLDSIPAMEGAGGRPVTEDKAQTPDAKATEQYRTGLQAAALTDPAAGDASSLANMLRVPSKIGKDTVSENTRQSLALEGIKAAIKVCPDANLAYLVEPFIGRCLVSSDKTMQEFGMKMRTSYNEVVGASDKGSTPIVKHRTGLEQTQD